MDVAFTALATVATALGFFAMVRLARLARELSETQAELLPLETARERLRIARGLDAALGARLAHVIGAGRRAQAVPDRDEVARIVATARTALAEVRTVSADQEQRPLAEELEAARSVLTAAGVPTEIDAGPVRLPADVDAALSALLHRTVLDLLRGEPPERCSIELTGSVSLTVRATGGRVTLDAAATAPINGLGGRVDVTPSSVRASVPVRSRPGLAGTAPRLAWFVLLTLEVDYFGAMLANMAQDKPGPGPLKYLEALTLVPVIAALQLRHVYPREHGAARTHLAELVTLAEQALSSLRSITDGRAAFSLRAEAEAAASMLSAAGVEVRMRLDAEPSGPAGSLLAIVLREAATNIVRHARARCCEIETSLDGGVLRLSVSNDGARRADPGRRGTGLDHLRARSREAGGALEVRRDCDRFALVAELPTARVAAA